MTNFSGVANLGFHDCLHLSELMQVVLQELDSHVMAHLQKSGEISISDRCDGCTRLTLHVLEKVSLVSACLRTVADSSPSAARARRSQANLWRPLSRSSGVLAALCQFHPASQQFF